MRRPTILCAALLLASVLPVRSMAQDDARAVPVFNAQHALHDVLNAAKAKDKAIVVVLQGGASYAGKVKDVGTGAVILWVTLQGLGVGAELSVTEFARVFFVVHILGSLAPTPGGVGVIEAGVTGALVAAGVATDVALGRLRGTVHRLGERRWPLVVTYHPAYLLRTPTAKRETWEDVKRVKRLLGRPEDPRGG